MAREGLATKSSQETQRDRLTLTLFTLEILDSDSTL